MHLLNPLRYLFRPVVSEKPSCPKTPTVSQKGIQARAIYKLIAQGHITAWEVQQLGTTDARKMFTRLRKLGLLFDRDCPHGHRMAPNKSGSGEHRVHFWTGKLPPEWVKTDTYVGRNRRKKPRGQN